MSRVIEEPHFQAPKYWIEADILKSISGTAAKMYVYLCYLAQQITRGTLKLKNRDFERAVGLSPNSVCAARRQLVRAHLISTTPAEQGGHHYSLLDSRTREAIKGKREYSRPKSQIEPVTCEDESQSHPQQPTPLPTTKEWAFSEYKICHRRGHGYHNNWRRGDNGGWVCEKCNPAVVSSKREIRHERPKKFRDSVIPAHTGSSGFSKSTPSSIGTSTTPQADVCRVPGHGGNRWQRGDGGFVCGDCHPNPAELQPTVHGDAFDGSHPFTFCDSLEKSDSTRLSITAVPPVKFASTCANIATGTSRRPRSRARKRS